jgi:hypothetical protein
MGRPKGSKNKPKVALQPPPVAAPVDILDSNDKPLLLNMYVRLLNGKPKHGQISRLSTESIDVKTERGLRTVRPRDSVGINPGQGRNRARYAIKLLALTQGASQKPRKGNI